MHPVLLELGFWRVTSYGLALTLGFAVGIGMAVVRARRFGLHAEPVLGVALVIVLSSIIGSRLFMLLIAVPEQGGTSWLEALNPFTSATGLSGLSVMGGLPAALICGYAYLRARRLPVLAYMDLLAPSVAFGAALARIGCLLNGCCHGIICDLPWAIRFPPNSIPHAALGPVSIHPTQLYQSAIAAALGILLLTLARRRPPGGVIVAALMLGMGAQRFVVEAFRHHTSEEVWIETGFVLSVYQGVAAVLMIAGLCTWYAALRRRAAA
jgi:phosphatidylglycerol:prolipoprotein diacylglycerol transferase